MRRLLLIVVLVLAAMGLAAIDASGSTGPPTQVPGAAIPAVPAPPAKRGCYFHRAHVSDTSAHAGWRRVTCDSAALISKKIPHPEVLDGINTSLRPGPAFRMGNVEAFATKGGTDTDTRYGAFAYSIQDNVFFLGNNGQHDSVQFTDQSEPGEANICVWQVIIPTQNYDSSCGSFSGSEATRVTAVQGWVINGTLFTAAVLSDGAYAVVSTSDTYGLGNDNRWNNNTGGILGYGDGSKAVFSGTDEYVQSEVGSCVAGGFVSFSGSPCAGISALSKSALYSSYSPGQTAGATEESNNLIPVLGAPPGHLPPLDTVGDISISAFAESTTGHCLSGSTPYCK
jgi:hypothetical protein